MGGGMGDLAMQIAEIDPVVVDDTDPTDARGRHAASLLNDGRVLVSGGFGAVGGLVSTAVFDPSDETWEPTGDLNEARYEHSQTTLEDGRVLEMLSMRDLTREHLDLKRHEVQALTAYIQGEGEPG